MEIRKVLALPVIAAAGLLLLVPGCDNSIEPFEEETGLFSIYGYLDITESPNYVRVRDLNDPLAGDIDTELDATVTLQNLADGTTEMLEDSLVQYDDLYVHNFRVEMPIDPETSYLLTVERSDGATVESEATAPAITDVAAGPEGEDCNTRIRFVFHDMEHPGELRLSLGFRYANNEYWQEISAGPGDGDYLVQEVSPQSLLDREFPPEFGHRVHCSDLDDDVIRVHYYHFGPEWLEHGQPVDPLESFDVDEGLGFFGALRQDAFTVEVDTSGPPPWEVF